MSTFPNAVQPEPHEPLSVFRSVPPLPPDRIVFLMVELAVLLHPKRPLQLWSTATPPLPVASAVTPRIVAFRFDPTATPFVALANADVLVTTAFPRTIAMPVDDPTAWTVSMDIACPALPPMNASAPPVPWFSKVKWLMLVSSSRQKHPTNVKSLEVAMIRGGGAPSSPWMSCGTLPFWTRPAVPVS